MRGLYNFPISGKGELKILCFYILPLSLSLIFLLASGKVESYSLNPSNFVYNMHSISRRWIIILSIIWIASVQAKEKKVTSTCESDADCTSKFPGTACISAGSNVKRCSSNTHARPACRGKHFGACPVYQNPDMGYLNVHCIFVAAEAASETIPDDPTDTDTDKSTDSDSSDSDPVPPPKSKRKAKRVEEDADTTTTSSTDKSTDSVDNRLLQQTPITNTTLAAGPTSTSDEDLTGDVPEESITIKFGKKSISGSFQCVDSSECESKAYDPSSCQVEACGQSEGSTTVCNNQGTCTYKSLQTITRRSCLCYPGFDGTKCENTLSAACDVDCGFGGDCVNGKCKCKAGFDGKNHKGKSGKKDIRCTKCTNDLACRNGTCDITSGKCVCTTGYFGPTCGATEDVCTKASCSDGGSCQPTATGYVCMCPICSPDCAPCPNNDCAKCDSAGVTLQHSVGLIFIAVLFGIVLLEL